MKDITLGEIVSSEGIIEISTKISTSIESSTGKIYNVNVVIGNYWKNN